MRGLLRLPAVRGWKGGCPMPMKRCLQRSPKPPFAAGRTQATPSREPRREGERLCPETREYVVGRLLGELRPSDLGQIVSGPKRTYWPDNFNDSKWATTTVRVRLASSLGRFRYQHSSPRAVYLPDFEKVATLTERNALFPLRSTQA